MTLSDLFSGYTSEAFRLELLTQYKSPDEWDKYQHFLKTGEITDLPDLYPYLEAARDKVNQGARHVRARVIDQITPYIIFETRIGYTKYADYGIELRFILQSDYETILRQLGFTSPPTDFWLFDNQTLAWMDYSDAGEFRGISTQQNDLDNYIALKDTIIANGFGLETLYSYFPELK